MKDQNSKFIRVLKNAVEFLNMNENQFLNTSDQTNVIYVFIYFNFNYFYIIFFNIFFTLKYRYAFLFV